MLRAYNWLDAVLTLMIDGKHSFPSIYGVFYTLFTVLAITGFIVFEILTTLNTIPAQNILNSQVPVSENFININLTVTGQPIIPKTGIFNVAFGLSDRHDSRSPIEDVDYGLLIPYQVTRNINGNYTYQMLDW